MEPRSPSADAAALDAADAAAALLEHLQALGDPASAEGMARFGISPVGTIGVSVTTLRAIARDVLRVRRADETWRHEVAARLWVSAVHEARVLATILDVPAKVTPGQAEIWAAASDSWDITDQLCMNLLDKAEFAYELAAAWSSREETFVKRAAFALMACLAWHDKGADDDRFEAFLTVIEREATDDRNFVTKAIDWALRQIGKRNAALHAQALEVAHVLAASTDRASRRVGRVAHRELESEAVKTRLGMGG